MIATDSIIWIYIRVYYTRNVHSSRLSMTDLIIRKRVYLKKKEKLSVFAKNCLLKIFCLDLINIFVFFFQIF